MPFYSLIPNMLTILLLFTLVDAATLPERSFYGATRSPAASKSGSSSRLITRVHWAHHRRLRLRWTGVIIQLFEWDWDSIAVECTQYIGPAGGFLALKYDTIECCLTT